MQKIRDMVPVRDYCHYTGKCRGDAHSICNLRYTTPEEIQFLRENIEKCIMFSVLMEKEVIRIDKNGEKNRSTISYRLQFVNSAYFYGKFLMKYC